jgi:ABC-type multidrug transport system fused ATPase/permease subunit
MRRIIIGASRDIEYDIRNDVFARLEQQPLAYYQERRTGDLMSRATNDLNAVRPDDRARRSCTRRTPSSCSSVAII